MKLWDKIVKGVNPDEEEPFNDVFGDDEIYDNSDGSFGGAGDISDFMSTGGNSPYGTQPQQYQGQYTQPPQQQQMQPYQQPAQPVSSGGISVTPGSNMQGSAEIKVIRPEDYENQTQIADHVINRRTVILNLEETPKETARRLLDFLNGVAYAIQGQIKRVSEKTFVIAPSNIVITPDQIKEESRKSSNTDHSIY